MSKGKLIIVRHTESEWNATGKWTGLTDVSLTAKGHREAELIGEELKDIRFDHAYTSEQIRTSETLESLLRTHGQTDLPHERRWAINERDYGEYTGMNKWEVKEKLGQEVFNGIRRGWDYPIPGGETLENVYHRAVPFYKEEVLPRLTKGENVLLVSHGNSIRALIKFIESISDEGIATTEMLFGTCLMYDVDDEGRMVNKETRSIKIDLPPA